MRLYWRRFGAPIGRGRPAPDRFQRNGEETEAKDVGDELAPFRREAESAQEADGDIAESKPADEHREPSAPEPSGHRIRRNDAEALGIGGEQKMADDHCDAGGEESDEITEYHLAQERRPIERQEGANAADGEGRNDAEGKGEARGDET